MDEVESPVDFTQRTDRVTPRLKLDSEYENHAHTIRGHAIKDGTEHLLKSGPAPYQVSFRRLFLSQREQQRNTMVSLQRHVGSYWIEP